MWPRPAGHLPAIASTICHRQERDGGDAELADQSSPSIGTVRHAPTAELDHNGDVPASAGQVTSSGKEAGA